MSYETRQKKKSEFTADNDVTSSSAFDFVKNGINKKTTWGNMLALFEQRFGLSMSVYEAESAMIADTGLELGNYAIVEENYYAVYKVTNIAAGPGDVTLSNGLTASQEGKCSNNNFDSYSDVRGLKSSAFKDGDVITVTDDGIAGDFVVKTGTVTDNGGTLIVFTDDSNRYAERSNGSKGVDCQQFGAAGDGVADDTSAILSAANASSYIEFPPGAYLVDQFPNIGSKDYVGIGTVAVNIASDSTGLSGEICKIMSNCRYEYINFTSNIVSLNSQRGAIDDSADIVLQSCSFNDFTHVDPLPNAWGILIQRSSRITIRECSFAGNSQSDIALTDNCENINIFNPKNTAEDGVYLNVEPNSGVGVRGMNVVGGHYRQVDLLENDNTLYQSQHLVFSGCLIDVLRYDGSGVLFNNCRIGSIAPEPASLTNLHAGSLMIDNCTLGENLLTDPHFFDVSPSDPVCFWTSTHTGATPAQIRVDDPVSRKFMRINPSNESQGVIISTRNNITVTPGEQLMLFMRGRMNNTGTGTNQVENVVVQWFDSGSALIQNTIIKTNKTPVNVQGDWTNDISLIEAPALAVSARIRFTNSFSSTYVGNLDIATVGLFRFTLNTTGGNMPEVIRSMSSFVTKKDYIRSTVFLGTNQNYGGMFVGERIIREVPAIGSPKAWSCTALPASQGFSGTTVSEGNL